MLGSTLTFLLYATLHPGTPVHLIAALMLLQGVSTGFGQQVSVIGGQNAVDPTNVGAATGTVTLARMAGASIAISIYGAVLSGSMAAHIHAISGVESIERLTPAELALLPDKTRALVAAVYTSAFHSVFLTMAGIIGIGLVAALLLRNIRLPANRGSAA